MNKKQIVSIVNRECSENMHPDIRIRWCENVRGMTATFCMFQGFEGSTMFLAITSKLFTTTMTKADILQYLREDTRLYKGTVDPRPLFYFQ